MDDAMTKTILFDLDDTLFDHHHSDQCGLRAVFDTFPIFQQIEQLEFEQQAMLVFDELWSNVLQKQMTLNQWQQAAFQLLGERLGFNQEHTIYAAVARVYREAYLKTRRSVTGAAALLSTLASYDNVTIGIVTNQLTAEQNDKLSACQLNEYIAFMVCAEQFDRPKPDPKIFKHALMLANAMPDSTVFVGDSWSSDVLGALAVGITPVWFNPQQQANPIDIEIKQLHALQPVNLVAHFLLNL